MRSLANLDRSVAEGTSVTPDSYDRRMLMLDDRDVGEDFVEDPWSVDEGLLGLAELVAFDQEQLVPHALDLMEPGLVLAAMLWSIDLGRCSGPERIRVLRARQRMASHYQAQVYDDIAGVSDHFEELDGDIELAHLGTVAEVRAALRLTRRAADSEVAFALDLKKRLPRVWDALLAGTIDVRRARTIVAATRHLPELDARQVAEQVMPRAGNLTTGQLGARLRKVCLDLNPDDAADRYRAATDDRRVVVEATPDGSANVSVLDAPAERASQASDYLNRCARELKTHDEERTLDQLRADVALDLLSGRLQPGQARGGGSVNLTVDLETLAGLANNSGELAGYGPVIADVARQVAHDQAQTPWRYTVQHQGQAVATGITRRRPTVGQRRHIEAQSPTCVFPGCRMPAVDCDLDHRQDWAKGGPTSVDNLAPLCRHDHLNKHRLGWSYRRLPEGRYQWTTKLGETYETERPP